MWLRRAVVVEGIVGMVWGCWAGGAAGHRGGGIVVRIVADGARIVLKGVATSREMWTLEECRGEDGMETEECFLR